MRKTKVKIILLCLMMLLSACASQAGTASSSIKEEVKEEQQVESTYNYNPKDWLNSFEFTLKNKHTEVTYPISDVEYITEKYTSDGTNCKWVYSAYNKEDPSRTYDIIVVSKDGDTYLDLKAHYNDVDDEQFFKVNGCMLDIDQIPANNYILHIPDIYNDDLKEQRTVTNRSLGDHHELSISGLYMSTEKDETADPEDTSTMVDDKYKLYIDRNGNCYQIDINTPFAPERITVKIDDNLSDLDIEKHERQEITSDNFESLVVGSLLK